MTVTRLGGNLARRNSGHRDVWFDFVKAHPERLNDSTDSFFRPIKQGGIDPNVLGWVEPHFKEVTSWSQEAGNVTKEQFHARVRNRGSKTLFVETIGFTVGDKRYPGLFSRFSSELKKMDYEVFPGHSASFLFWSVELDNDDIDRLGGMYLVAGTGDVFINKQDSLTRLIQEFREEANTTSK